jgi:hypothetical protein
MNFDDLKHETEFQTSGGDVKFPIQFNIDREHGDIFADFVCVEIGGLSINSIDAVKAFGSEQVSRAEGQRLKTASNVCFGMVHRAMGQNYRLSSIHLQSRRG